MKCSKLPFKAQKGPKARSGKLTFGRLKLQFHVMLLCKKRVEYGHFRVNKLPKPYVVLCKNNTGVFKLSGLEK